MRSFLHLHDQRLSIVIPNARSFPLALVEQLESQAVEGDEIFVIQNRSRLGPRRWIGSTSGARLPLLRGIDLHARSTTARGITMAVPETIPIILLRSNEGAAAARNLGWRTAKNNWILFLDDDVMINETFLIDVRQYLTQRSIASVVTFRVLSTSTSQWSSLVRATISLGRGSEIRRTGKMPLRLEDVWMYGVGTAMLVNRSALQATGGFKDQLGAGRRNGGTEDAEFLWHVSYHTSLEYHGRIVVLHKEVSSFHGVARKMCEYGRAIGHLGGITKSVEGYRYVTGYCRHLKEATHLNEIVQFPARSLFRVRAVVTFAVLETLRVYGSSLVRGSRSRILCDQCRGGFS